MVEQGQSFFEKNNNITVEREDRKLKRIDFLDRRCYQTPEGKYYPSVTTVLSYMPVGQFFLDWLADVGHNSKIIRDRAAREGTQVHEGIEKLLAGEKLDWVSEFGTAKYNLQVWQMLLRFQDFFNIYKPETLGSELFLWSDEYEYAGATDWLCRFKDLNWLIDFKTSNHLSKGYDLQLAAYAKALEERMGIKVDRAAVLWLKASTRSYSKKEGVYQGPGWQLKLVDNLDQDFEAFKHVYAIYKLYNPTTEPIYSSYPTEIFLENTAEI